MFNWEKFAITNVFINQVSYRNPNGHLALGSDNEIVFFNHFITIKIDFKINSMYLWFPFHLISSSNRGIRYFEVRAAVIIICISYWVNVMFLLKWTWRMKKYKFTEEYWRIITNSILDFFLVTQANRMIQIAWLKSTKKFVVYTECNSQMN